MYQFLTCLAVNPNVSSMGTPSECGGILMSAEGEHGVTGSACHIGHGYWLTGSTLSIDRAGECPHVWA